LNRAHGYVGVQGKLSFDMRFTQYCHCVVQLLACLVDLSKEEVYDEGGMDLFPLSLFFWRRFPDAELSK
jgi:hypothetical protein